MRRPSTLKNAIAIKQRKPPYAETMPKLAINMPPSAGPDTKASAWLVEATVTARWKRSGPTICGKSAVRAGPSNDHALDMITTPV
jgi:hypothetical protein